jgi:very-short-patch-repair endonuclease
MNSTHNKKLKHNAQQLRKNMTKEERRLWYDFLKTLPVTVHRQKVFENYIVDFYIASAKLVIELDGSQHFESAGQAQDAQRDGFLKARGLTVLRIPNNEVNQNFSGVCEGIWNRLSPEKPSPEGEADPLISQLR